MSVTDSTTSLDAARLERYHYARDLRDRVAERERRRHRRRLRHYARHPAAWAADNIEWTRGRAAAPYQLEALEGVARHHRFALRGPRGLGKTTTAALAVLWFATTRDALGIDWKVLTTAGVGRHLTRNLWPEIHKWAPRLTSGIYTPPAPDKQLLTASLHMHHGQAYGAVARDPDLIEGVHADQLLILIDEGKSVKEAIWDALEGALTGETGQYALALSTPGAPAGRFYEIHQGKHPDWTARHVTTDEAVSAGRIARRWVASRGSSWGTATAMYRQQVLGEFAADDQDAVVPLSWVDAAMLRWHEWADAGRPALEGVRSYAVDVATSGGDKTVIATRIGRHITRFDYMSAGSTMDTVARVQAIVGKHVERQIVVDVIGVGSGVADRLTELGYNVMRYNGAAGTDYTDAAGDHGFTNTRSAAYWRVRELLSPDVAASESIMLPPRQELTADLTTPTWRTVTGVPPKIAIETKEDVNDRLGRSTDFGDAVAMAYWGDAERHEVEIASTSRSRLPRRSYG